jgi:hypothetical protein
MVEILLNHLSIIHISIYAISSCHYDFFRRELCYI